MHEPVRPAAGGTDADSRVDQTREPEVSDSAHPNSPHRKLLRVAILGAESTGKSTLSAALAAHFDALWVPEYLREFVDLQQRTPQEHEQLHIATTQLAREQAATEVAQQRGDHLLFCDTTPLMTAIYSRFYWGRVDAPLAVLARTTEYHHTIVTAPDGTWVADGLQRESETVQRTIHQQLLASLTETATPYLLVAGNPSQRMAQVLEYLAQHRAGIA